MTTIKTRCPKCGGLTEYHAGCSQQPDPHWYCLTADCGGVVSFATIMETLAMFWEEMHR